METEKKKVGNAGEKLIVEYIKSKEYYILDTNFRSGRNEVDIIALDNKVLVFIEVKSRKNKDYCEAREAVNRNKQVNIYKVARSYISKTRVLYDEIRFDVAEVYYESGRIDYFENAF